MQIPRVQPASSGDGHAGVLQCRQQRCDDVPAGHGLGLQHHDDSAARAPESGLQRIAGSEGRGRGQDLNGGIFDPGLGSAHDEHVDARGRGIPDCAEGRFSRLVLAGDDDHRSGGAGHLVEARRDRVHRAVERALTVRDVVWACRLQIVAGTEVDDLPAGFLDAGLELVGGTVVALDAGSGAFVGERNDLVGC